MDAQANAKTHRIIRNGLLVLFMFTMVGCAVQKTTPVKRIALLAPFEGRYREIGYQALYAARMAIAETKRTDLELYAIDDGGSVKTAIVRAEALRIDSSVETVLVLGIYAADEQVLAELEGIPIQVVGDWEPVWDINNANLVTAPHDIQEIAQLDVEYSCGDICLLTAFPLLANDPTLANIVTQSPPVTDDFRQNYVQFDQFVPEPLPIAPATYQAMQYVIELVSGNTVPDSDTSIEYNYQYTSDGTLLISE